MTLTEVQAMTPEEKRVKLAELLHWTEIREQDYCEAYVNPYEGAVLQYWEGISPTGEKEEIPDFCNDLNEVHSVERSLESHLWTDYAMTIRKVIQQECRKEEFYIPGTERAQLIADIWFYCATAEQRTTVLILTLSPCTQPSTTHSL